MWEGRRKKAELALTWFLEDLGHKGETIKGDEKVRKGAVYCLHRFANTTFVSPGETDNINPPCSGGLRLVEVGKRERECRIMGSTGPPLIRLNILESPLNSLYWIL